MQFQGIAVVSGPCTDCQGQDLMYRTDDTIIVLCMQCDFVKRNFHTDFDELLIKPSVSF